MKLYGDVKNPGKAILRDLNHLISLGTMAYKQELTGAGKRKEEKMFLWARMEWPSEMTETEFFRKLNTLPRVKGTLFIPR